MLVDLILTLPFIYELLVLVQTRNLEISSHATHVFVLQASLSRAGALPSALPFSALLQVPASPLPEPPFGIPIPIPFFAVKSPSCSKSNFLSLTLKNQIALWITPTMSGVEPSAFGEVGLESWEVMASIQ